MISRPYFALVRRLLPLMAVVPVALAWPAQAVAAAPGPAPSPAPAAAAPMRPALWMITRGKTIIYLFGTIHMLPPGADWLRGPVARAIDRAGEIATEIDDPDGMHSRIAAAARASLPAGITLSALLPPAKYAALGADLVQYGQSADRLDRYRPWYAALVLSTLPLLRRGFDAHRGVEATLTARTAARTIRHIGIETAAEQIALLDGLPPASQTAYLSSVIDEFAHIDRDIDAMVCAWGTGDAAAIARLMIAEDGKDDPVLIEPMITARNRHFAAWIGARLRQPGVVFMAIGAGHLAGPHSVQDDLARAHIRVMRLQ